MKKVVLFFLLLPIVNVFAQRGRGDLPPKETVLTVNTSEIRRGFDYTLDVKGTTNTYPSGLTQSIGIAYLGATDDVIITIPAATTSEEVKVVFNMAGGEIINLRARIDYEGATYDAYFDNEQFITTSGQTITFHDSDQSNIIDNKLYLSLEGGLVFSPNGDSNHDELFLVMEEDFDITSIQIAKIDGTVLYSTTDKNFVWNGMIEDELVDPGVYNYTILADDETIKGQFLIQY